MTVLLLAWLDAHPHNLQHAVEKAVAALQGVLQATAEAAGDAAFAKERDAKVHCDFCSAMLRAAPKDAVATPAVHMRCAAGRMRRCPVCGCVCS